MMGDRISPTECSERELLYEQLTEYARHVPIEQLRMLCNAADAWAYEAMVGCETIVCSDKGLRFVPAGSDGPRGGKAG